MNYDQIRIINEFNGSLDEMIDAITDLRIEVEQKQEEINDLQKEIDNHQCE